MQAFEPTSIPAKQLALLEKENQNSLCFMGLSKLFYPRGEIKKELDRPKADHLLTDKALSLVDTLEQLLNLP